MQDGSRLTLWPSDSDPDAPREPRVLRMANPDAHFPPTFDADGSRLVWGSSAERTVSVWRLEGPPDADPVVLLDLAEGTRRRITTHGSRIEAVALDPSGAIIVTGNAPGAVRVGRADGGEPHLLLGHSDTVNWHGNAPAVSPDGRWIASAAGSEIRLWPMPDVTQPPLHTLPLEELLAKLHELTNVQVVEDDASPTGYRIDVGPLPGWKDVPTWFTPAAPEPGRSLDARDS